MKPIKAIIADDESHLRIYLRSLLHEVWPELVLCGEAKNGEEAIDLIRTQNPDVAFLDIKMPGLTGMEVAKQIAGTCRVVFITAYNQYAVEAFEKEALDYLLKPVDQQSLVELITQAHHRQQRWRQALAETWQRQKETQD